MQPALVFNCHYNGLAIIQELGRHGVSVHALDSIRSIGTVSRYGRFHQCPDPETNEEDFIRFLLEFGKRLPEKAVLFPTNDHWAIATARHRDSLSENFIPCVSPAHVVELLIEKQRFYDWATQREYPVPRSWKSTDTAQIPENAFPLAAKPEFRRTAGNDATTAVRSKVLDQKRLTVLRTAEELKAFEAEIGEFLPYFIFQEYVEGLSDCMITVGVYADRESEVMGVFTGRKVRGFPPDVGDCIVGQSESVPTEIVDMVKRMCKELGYQGIAEFEFKRDAVTGEYKLIEINPRSWSWVGITPACGVSLPWMAYCDLTGHEPIRYTESHAGAGVVKYVKILPDWWNCTHSNRRAGYPEWHMSTWRWWKSLRSGRLVIAEFAKDDLRPTLYALREFLKLVLTGYKTRVTEALKRAFRKQAKS